MKSGILLMSVMLVAAGCGDDWKENPDQQQFYETFVSSNSTDSQIQVLKSANSRPVQDWNAVVRDVSEDGDLTIIHASYGNMDYRLFLFGEESRAKARSLQKEARLTFSGDLGPELSVTLLGARTNPEFEFYPDSIASGELTINQEPAAIASRHEHDREQLAQEQAEDRRKDQESAVEDDVVQLCRNTVLENLQYPASGSFSWFEKQVVKETDTKWVYRDVITAKNSLGAELPSRFICTVKIKNDEMSANLRFLDGP